MVWRRRAAPHHAHHAGAYNKTSACVYAGGFTPEHDVVGASSPLPGEEEGTCTPLLQETSPSCTRWNTSSSGSGGKSMDDPEQSIVEVQVLLGLRTQPGPYLAFR